MRHEVELESVQTAPDGTVTSLWVRESYDDDAISPLAIDPRQEPEWVARRARVRQRQRAVNGVLCIGIGGLLALGVAGGALVGALA